MKVNVGSYEQTSLDSLVKGDMFVYHDTLFTVLHKSFEMVTIFNHTKNTTDCLYIHCKKEVTRIKSGVISV